MQRDRSVAYHVVELSDEVSRCKHGEKLGSLYRMGLGFVFSPEISGDLGTTANRVRELEGLSLSHQDIIGLDWYQGSAGIQSSRKLIASKGRSNRSVTIH